LSSDSRPYLYNTVAADRQNQKESAYLLGTKTTSLSSTLSSGTKVNEKHTGPYVFLLYFCLASFSVMFGNYEVSSSICIINSTIGKWLFSSFLGWLGTFGNRRIFPERLPKYWSLESVHLRLTSSPAVLSCHESQFLSVIL